MKKETKKYREIMKWKENKRLILGKNCQKNGICFLFDKVFYLLYPNKAQFLKEYHGKMPKDTISVQKRLTTDAKNNAGKNYLLTNI